MTSAPSSPPDGFLAARLPRALAAALTGLAVLFVADAPRLLGLALFVEQYLAVVMGIAFAVCYLTVPARPGPRLRVPGYDALLAALGLGVMIHVAINYERLLIDVSSRTAETLFIGLVVVGLVLEGLRRAVGYTLLAVVLVFIAYSMLGDLVPGDLEGRPVDPEQLVNYLAFDTNSLLGVPLRVGSTVVIVFILLGQLLFAAGGGQFFTDLAMAAMGRRRGGAAKIAVVASALFGSISGTAVSNVVTTGVVTIPLMRRSGYSPEQSGAIEAVASTGGQFMPPIMGASAFLIAEFLHVPYAEVMLAALLPALLYFLAIFIQVDLVAARRGISEVDVAIPRPRVVLAGGWYFLIPFAVLIYAMFWRLMEPEEAGLYTCGALVVVGMALSYQGSRLSPGRILAAFVQTGQTIVELFMILAAAGFVIGILGLTGLGFALTLFLVNLGGGNVIVLLVIAAAICIVLGMGMPTIGVYILLAALVAPSLVQAGVFELSAHLFILYFGMMSMITPPIAMAAFAATTISRGRPMATGWMAMRFGWVAYLIPFLFVMSPALLGYGSALEVALAAATAMIGVYYASIAVVGYFARPLGPAVRLVLAAAGVASVMPADLAADHMIVVDLAGIALGAAVLLREHLAARRARPALSE